MECFYTRSKAAFFILFMALSGLLPIFSGLVVSMHAQTVQQVWATLNPNAAPQAIAVDALGNVYTANANNTISKITAAASVTQSWAILDPSANPVAIAIDVSGNVYTANANNHTVSKITAAGSVTLIWAQLADGANPTCIAIDLSGNVYTGNTGDDTVSKITAAGVVTQTWAQLVSGMSPAKPLGIAIDLSNNVYTANHRNHTVSKITAAGSVTPIWAQLTDGATPWSITIDALGNVYTANSGDDTVSKITAAGSVTPIWAQLAMGASPIAIKLGMSNSIYTANNNNVISKITSTGTLTDPWATLNPMAFPSGIAIDASGNIYTANSGNSTISKITASVLPIELLSFSGKNTESGNRLTWATASETNNKGFDIERSTDGTTFHSIGQVKGNNKPSSYQFVDNQPFKMSFYRLKQVDFDGTTTYSNMVSVAQKGKGEGLKIYPTLVTDGFLTVETAATDFSIYNVSGQTVQSGTTAQRIDISALVAGMYIFSVGTEQAKFVKQ